ncbi:hypothetical protein DFJ74DRAFT_218333 [Hyaloraphidium curvatum]|nr:hypothetical protein DFJ74DRAFT_218333 [Hyaloraphidium curvatum]
MRLAKPRLLLLFLAALLFGLYRLLRLRTPDDRPRYAPCGGLGGSAPPSLRIFKPLIPARKQTDLSPADFIPAELFYVMGQQSDLRPDDVTALADSLHSLGVNTSSSMVFFAFLENFRRDYGFATPEAALQSIREVSTTPKSKWFWRYFCYRFLNQASLLDLPAVELQSRYEAVFLEFRPLPHVEFVIRNTFRNLGPGWMLRLVCGHRSCELLRDIAARVSPHVVVAHHDIDEKDVNGYNDLLLSQEFWESLEGEKILIFQEDSIVFRPGVHRFMSYDFVGSPWPRDVNDTPGAVGNGGISLRTRSKMLDALKRIRFEDLRLSPGTATYVRKVGLQRPPEDVFFAQALSVYGVGHLAPREIAMSWIESHDSNFPFAGHDFWQTKSDWVPFLDLSFIVRMSFPTVSRLEVHDDNTRGTHLRSAVPSVSAISSGNGIRNSWSRVLRRMAEFELFSSSESPLNPSRYALVDSLDIFVAPSVAAPPESRIIAFFHGVESARPINGICTVEQLWKSESFLAALPRIDLIMTFTEHVADVIRATILATKGAIARVRVVPFPITDMDRVKIGENAVPERPENRSVLTVASSLTFVSSIYRLIAPEWTKVVAIPGDFAADQTTYLGRVRQELRNWKVDESIVDVSHVQVRLAQNPSDFVLGCQVLFLHFRTLNYFPLLLEAVAFQTPILVNRHPAVEELLGSSYPLFFETLDEASSLLQSLTGEVIACVKRHFQDISKRRTLNNFVLQVYNVVHDVMAL